MKLISQFFNIKEEVLSPILFNFIFFKNFINLNYSLKCPGSVVVYHPALSEAFEKSFIKYYKSL